MELNYLPRISGTTKYFCVYILKTSKVRGGLTNEGTPGIIDQKVAEDFTDRHIWKGQRNGPHAIYRNCREINEPDYLTDRIAEEGIAYIERNRDKPFFLYLPYNAVHTPMHASAEREDRFSKIQDKKRRTFATMLAAVDDGVGQVAARGRDCADDADGGVSRPCRDT